LAEGAGYSYRALVEADISRYKRVIGDALRSRTDAPLRSRTDAPVERSRRRCRALNRMVELGPPEYVRIV